MNFIKHKWLVSEYNEFRQNDPAYLRRKEKREEWKRNNNDKVLESSRKYQKNNRDEINKKMNERYRAIKWITK